MMTITTDDPEESGFDKMYIRYPDTDEFDDVPYQNEQPRFLWLLSELAPVFGIGVVIGVVVVFVLWLFFG